MNLKLSNSLKNSLPNYQIIAYHITFDDSFDVMTKSDMLTNDLAIVSDNLHKTLNYEEITKIEKLKETRDAYKTLGKDPSHTRPACEALLRRVVKGDGLYRLGDVIDVGNLLSLETLRSVCVVDYKMIKGDVLITVGSNISYEGIGKGLINANNLIIYTDGDGIFGSPTSDTNRTKVTSSTHDILVMLMCCSSKDIKEDEQKLIALYKKYTYITNIEKINVE